MTWKEVLEILRATAPSGSEVLYRPRYNLAPAQQHWIVRQKGDQRLMEPAIWGFKGSKGLLINARSETAQRLPTFRKAFAESRCLVPADGFYEWQGKKGQRVPLWFYPREGLLLMAGLYRQDEDGPRFVVLTAAANESMRAVHDRMPALLSVEDASAWLERPDPALLRPAPEDWLERRKVSARVNSIANDDPQCQEAATGPRPSRHGGAEDPDQGAVRGLREMLMQNAGYKYAALVFSAPERPTGSYLMCGSKETRVGNLLSLIPQDEHARWEKWLGSVAWGRIERANSIVVSRASASAPAVLDDDDERLRRNVKLAWQAFLLCGADVGLDPAWIVSGQSAGDSRASSLLTVRAFQEMDRIIWPLYRNRPRYIEVVAMRGCTNPDYSWFSRWLEIDRLLSQPPYPLLLRYAFLAYYSARTRNLLEFSIPEFVRAVEGVVALGIRKGKRDFEKRALRLLPGLRKDEYVGGDIHDLLRELYELRSACVHGKLPFFDLQSRGDAGEERAAQLAYLAEILARETVLFALRLPDKSIFENRAELEQAWENGTFPPAA